MATKRLLRRLLRRLLTVYGYDLKIESQPLRKPRHFFQFVRSLGFEAGTVIDVGVGFGTPWLYESFPGSYFLLVEPNDAFVDDLERICAQYSGEYHLFAAGDRAYTESLGVDTRTPTSSSLLTAVRGVADSERAVRTAAKEVPVRPLDSIYRESLTKPFLIKLDVEGFEVIALKGAKKFLANAEMVVQEVSVRDRFFGGSRFSDVVSFMSSEGFQLFDVIDLVQREDGPLVYLDAVFVREGSSLWSRHGGEEAPPSKTVLCI